MTQSRRAGNRKILIGVIVAACVCLLAITGFNMLDPNARTRATIESILIAESTRQKKLEELAPYVKIGENISAVHKRIAPNSKEEFGGNRPAEHAYGLADSNLVLAIRANGTIVGIGRHRYGTDDGTVWIAPPQW